MIKLTSMCLSMRQLLGVPSCLESERMALNFSLCKGMKFVR